MGGSRRARLTVAQVVVLLLLAAAAAAAPAALAGTAEPADAPLLAPIQMGMG